MAKPSIFVSYSHKDRTWMLRFLTHLEVLGDTFDVWTDDKIGAGEAWDARIEAAMAKASVAVLLVSANSLTSKFILKREIVELLKRRDREGLKVFPVIVRQCAWRRVEWLAAMQVRPLDGRPLYGRKGADIDTELTKIALELVDMLGAGEAPAPATARILNWEEERDTSQFIGRSTELDQIKNLLLQTRLLALVGRGGMGKSLLLSKAAVDLQDRFDRVIWRTLKDAKTLQELLASCLRVLTSDKPGVMPVDFRARVRALLEELKQNRCLLMLDNVESILDAGGEAGTYRRGYADYEEFFTEISETPHRSCIVITTRELPEQFRAMAGDGPVRVYTLGGLDAAAARQLLSQKKVNATDEEVALLVHKFGGNPQDIKLVADPILTVFGGSVSAFLEEGEAIAGVTERTLAWHFDRTSALEANILYWLAISYEPVSRAALSGYLESNARVGKGDFQEAMQSLDRRSLMEILGGRFALQGVVMEYVLRRFIEAAADEIRNGKTDVLHSHPLLLAGSRDSIKRSQERQIIGAIVEALSDLDDKEVNARIVRLLDDARRRQSPRRGYSAGNVVNLLRARKVDLTGIDLSGLAVWQAYLQGAEFRRAKLDDCDLSGSVFTETFSDITAVACHPNGALAATGSTSGEVRLWRLPEATLLHRFDGHSNEVWTLAFSPTGKILVSGGEDETVRFWDLDALAPAGTLTETGGAVFALAFHPAGRQLAYAGNGGTLAIRNVETGSSTRSQKAGGGIYALAWSASGEMIASGDSDRLVRLWRVSGEGMLPESPMVWSGHAHWVRTVAFSPDSRYVASGSYDNSIRLWDTASGDAVRELTGHTGWVRSVAFSPLGRLASGSNDGTVRLWDVSNGRCERVLEGHVGTVWSVAWAPDGKTVLSGGNDQTIRFWDAEKGEDAVVLKGFVNSIRGLAFHPDGKLLASGGSDHHVRIWNLESGTHRTLRGHSDWVRSVSFDHSGDRLFSAGSDRTVRAWNTESGAGERVLSGHKNWIYHVACTVDSRLVTCSTDRTARVWDLSSGTGSIVPSGANEVAGYSVAVSADGRLLAAGGEDHAIRLWNVDANKCERVFVAHTRLVTHLAFDSPASRLISSGDKRVLLWDVAAGELRRELTGHRDWVRCAVFSPDGRFAASSADDREVRLWDCETGDCLWVGREHTGIVFSVAFHPSEGLVASASNDETIRFWDIRTGKCVRLLRNDRPYEGASIRGVTGLTEAQKRSLVTLGAVD